MQKYSHGRKRLEQQMQYRLSVAGNGLFLAGSILYMTDTGAILGTWAFIVGSAVALLASLLPQIASFWFCPAEEDADDSLAGSADTTAPVVAVGAAA